MQPRAYTLVVDLVLGADSDPRAPGGAVTKELCGHWEHDGACRWPHHTAIETTEDGHRVVVTFECGAEERAAVEGRIRAALEEGRLTGPDGAESSWTVSNPRP